MVRILFSFLKNWISFTVMLSSSWAPLSGSLKLNAVWGLPDWCPEQSRPLETRATILCISYNWMDIKIKILLTPNIFFQFLTYWKKCLDVGKEYNLHWDNLCPWTYIDITEDGDQEAVVKDARNDACSRNFYRYPDLADAVTLQVKTTDPDLKLIAIHNKL